MRLLVRVRWRCLGGGGETGLHLLFLPAPPPPPCHSPSSLHLLPTPPPPPCTSSPGYPGRVPGHLRPQPAEVVLQVLLRDGDSWQARRHHPAVPTVSSRQISGIFDLYVLLRINVHVLDLFIVSA